MKSSTQLFLTSLSLALGAMLMPATASADVLASKAGKCPSNYTPYTKHGAIHCKTPEKAPRKDAKSSKK